ncbi:MAG: Ig-like domain-containing protein [Marinilabiliales bacterium]|nr:Ig-like domain-containing protein [Marinilabiliales bacterium]
MTGVYSFMDGNRTVAFTPAQNLDHYADYTLEVTSSLKGVNGETFPGVIYTFKTVNGKMVISSITLNGQTFMPPAIPKNVSRTSTEIIVNFSEALNPSDYQSYFSFQAPAVLCSL